MSMYERSPQLFSRRLLTKRSAPRCRFPERAAGNHNPFFLKLPGKFSARIFRNAEGSVFRRWPRHTYQIFFDRTEDKEQGGGS